MVQAGSRTSARGRENKPQETSHKAQSSHEVTHVVTLTKTPGENPTVRKGSTTAFKTRAGMDGNTKHANIHKETTDIEVDVHVCMGA
jgi:hypothetical protein